MVQSVSVVVPGFDPSPGVLIPVVYRPPQSPLEPVAVLPLSPS
jgi:hypothetical protein